MVGQVSGKVFPHVVLDVGTKIKQVPRDDATELLSGSQYLVFQSLLPKLNEVGEWAKELSRRYESDWQLAIEGGE